MGKVAKYKVNGNIYFFPKYNEVLEIEMKKQIICNRDKTIKYSQIILKQEPPSQS